jgi:hypothetical protein
VLSDLPQLPGAQYEDATRYATSMAEVRERLTIARRTIAAVKAAGSEDVVSIETIFIQFRKCLELIVFGSLIANRDIYSQQYTDYQNDGRAKKLVEHLRKLNPDFYPVPVSAPVSTGHRTFSLAAATEPYLTDADLVRLFDISSRILHIRNPFSQEPVTHNLGFSVDEWADRIQALLRWHFIQQLNGPRWLVQIPESGKVHVYPGLPSGPVMP